MLSVPPLSGGYNYIGGVSHDEVSGKEKDDF